MTWLGLDLGLDLGGGDVAEVEHRVLHALAGLDRPAGIDRRCSIDHVATHTLAAAGAPSRTAVTLRVAEAPGVVEQVCAELHRLLGGTLVSPRQVYGDPGPAADCRRIAAESAAGTAGRCVRFPGQATIGATVGVSDLLARTAIVAVRASGWPVGPDDVVAGADHQRPQFEEGRLVLRVGPAAGGVLRPVEIASPHQCFAGSH